jgi:hypothetical protein
MRKYKKIRVTLRLATEATNMTPHVRWVAEWSGLKRSNNRDVDTIIFVVTKISSLAKFYNIKYKICKTVTVPVESVCN